jgi:uncharacterized protein YcgL (UPF0745 family)
MQCTVYKSLRQFDYFLYVRTADGFSRVPDSLQQLLGRLEKVIEVELHAGRRLARADVEEVMGQIQAQGYYLQMPPLAGTVPLVS